MNQLTDSLFTWDFELYNSINPDEKLIDKPFIDVVTKIFLDKSNRFMEYKVSYCDIPIIDNMKNLTYALSLIIIKWNLLSMVVEIPLTQTVCPSLAQTITSTDINSNMMPRSHSPQGAQDLRCIHDYLSNIISEASH